LDKGEIKLEVERFVERRQISLFLYRERIARQSNNDAKETLIRSNRAMFDLVIALNFLLLEDGKYGHEAPIRVACINSSIPELAGSKVD